jgi:diguanylate cyclase (GGDEF)-like protein/PAS domain S-box-containing protein
MGNRLSVRIALAVGLLAMIGAMTISVFSYIRTQTTEIINSQHIVRQLGLTVLHTAGIAVYLDNREIADEAIQGLANNEIVAAVSLTSVNGMTASYGDPQKQLQESAVHFKLDSPFTPGNSVGELVLYPRQDLIALKARTAALERALLLGGYTLVIAMLVMFIIQWQFVPTLQQMAMDLHGINPGGPERLKLPEKHSNNELGRLVQDINYLLSMTQEKLESERLLREQIEGLELRFRIIYERASVGIFMLDDLGRVFMANNAFCKIVGIEKFHSADKERDSLFEFFSDANMATEMIETTMKDGKHTESDLLLARSTAQAPRWAHCLFTRIQDDSDGQSTSHILVQGILTDITDRKLNEQLIRYHAERDPLTQLLNRRSSDFELAKILARADVENKCVAICLIDLDNFKPINDTHGHEAGDKVLITVANRMRAALRTGDIIARVGGDEFVVAIMDESCRTAIEAVAEKLLKSLTEDILLDNGHRAKVGASIGIALSSEHGADFSRLMTFADQAMYQVKKRGKNDFQVYQAP